ncbi:Cytochrome p450 [Thalictrum thalictroides]|uniref:Cytochrome p450 n=1 Tax=Thalictrum thalictroides TaxID=46969 RepID=A0A7J6VXD9_THATH|nr:Cytochrome p450 [Thalictrum thalictroides]
MGGFHLLSLVFGLVIIFLLLRKFLLVVWWIPRNIEKQFRNQGIKGPSYKFLVGSFGELAKIYGSKPKPDQVVQPIKHTLIQDLLPHLHLWIKKYGKVFLYWYGPSPRVIVTDPELIKEMLNNTKSFIKAIPHPAIYDLVGDGLLFAEGELWSRHRKIISPFFTIEALKGYVETCISSNNEMIKRWNDSIMSDGSEFEVHNEFRMLTKDIIARTAFPSNFKQVDRIVELQIKQMSMLTQALRTFYIPGSRFLPTPFNIKSWMLRRELEKMFKELIKSRDKSSRDNDLLGLMLSATNNDHDKGNKMSSKELMDECRIFFVAGFETTSLLVTWAFVLMGIHTEWQEKARHEVEQVLQGKPPDYDSLARLKIVNMILNETLRLYSPAPFIMKTVEKETKLGDLTIPAGIDLEIPLIAVHHDSQQWGNDVDQFNPARFAEGAVKASKHPMAFLPFTSGTRVCIGMNFAMMEAKITLAMMLQKFSFVISPNYKHSPDCLVTTSPVHGAHILFQKI